MLERTGDYLRKLATQLGLDRYDALVLCQEELERRYPGQARAVSLNQQVLKIATPNATVAGDLRLRQVEVLNKLRQVAAPQAINSLNIQIRDL